MGWDVYRSRGGVIASALAVQIISSICVSLRFYTRWWRRQVILASDWVVLAAFVCGTALTVMELYGVAVKAFAVPLSATSISDVYGRNHRLALVQHMEYAFVIIGVFTIGLIKLSVCLLYWHIFSRVKFRRLLTAWTIIIIAWTITFVAGELLECGIHPLKIFGTREDVQKYCPNVHHIGYALVGSDIATDLITLIIPIPLVFGMHLPTARKVLVSVTFMIGVLAVAASTAKAYVYIAASLALTHEDGIILVTAYSIWNLVEVHVGIIAACGMTLRPVLARIFPTERFIQLYSSLRWTKHSGHRGSDGGPLPSFVQVRSASISHAGRPQQQQQPRREEVVDCTQETVRFQTSALPEVV